jgi:exocyst complex component 2
MLLVMSNFGYLADALIPSMLSQLEAAFGTSMLDERQVSELAGIDRSSPVVY